MGDGIYNYQNRVETAQRILERAKMLDANRDSVNIFVGTPGEPYSYETFNAMLRRTVK